MDWKTIDTAPFDCEMELAVIEPSGTHALVFPCRRGPHGWVDSATGLSANVHPTHWREWDDSMNGVFQTQAPPEKSYRQPGFANGQIGRS